MKWAKHILFASILAEMFPGISIAGSPNLPLEQRKVLEDPSRFNIVRTVAVLPGAIVALCGDLNGGLAEPGAKWETTDYIRDETLSRKRLIWAAISGDHHIVHYESGGYVHSFHIIVATLGKEGKQPKVVWRGIGGLYQDHTTFLLALRNGELDDASNDH